MYKILLMSLIVVIGSLEITIQNFHSLSAQKTTVPPILNNTTSSPFTKFFSESKDYQHCIEHTNSCHSTVDVIYESPTTLLLKSHSMNPLWKAVDTVKKLGYSIDAVTYLPNANTSNPNTPFDILVVMSQNPIISHPK